MQPSSEPLTCYYPDGDTLRSRSVGTVLLRSCLDVPAPPAKLLADWHREIAQELDLQAGDVEPLRLAGARLRWPAMRACVQAVADWTQGLGLQRLADCDMALMACRGARYHHDGVQYGGKAFCNLFLSEDRHLDLHFPGTGERIPLVRGTVVVFDTGQPHAVIARQRGAFDAADFPTEPDCTQVFLTWELPIEDARLAHALQLRFDTDPANAGQLQEPQVWAHGAAARVCPQTGRWLALDVR